MKKEVQTKMYVKKPIPVVAYQYTMEHFINVEETPGISYDIHTRPYIKTLEGEMQVNIGSYICQGIDGEYWAVKQNIFERTYDEVTL